MIATAATSVRVRLTPESVGAHARSNCLDVSADAITFDGHDVVLWRSGAAEATFAVDEVTMLELAPLPSRTATGESWSLEEKRAAHPNAYLPWTAEQDALLLKRHGDGADVRTLSAEFGRNPGAIRSRLRKLFAGPVDLS